MAREPDTPERRHAIYIDTPVLTALRQVEPFFESGIFDTSHCAIYIRRRALVQLQRLFTVLPRSLGIRSQRGTTLTMAEGNLVFYPFNAQSNMNVLTQRQYRHVLTLHGESNKAASFRPASRMYDYICVAGPLAIDRYLEAGIFTPEEAHGGRLIQMGDSFVQRLPWLRPATEADGAAASIFYCPTWEGFGAQTKNYSSVIGGWGFEAVVEAARALDVGRIVIKPHPYLGLLRQGMWRDFIVGLRGMVRCGLKVELALDDMPAVTRLLFRAALAGVPLYRPDPANPLPVRLGITDVSGVAAVLLTARIPAVVAHVTPPKVSPRMQDIEPLKSIAPGEDIAAVTRAYLEQADAIDTRHRDAIIGWHDPALPAMAMPERLAWLIDHVQRDPYWNDKARGG
ncbi:MAG: hypothetical protein HOL32_11555 [Octadecabacter sp.]|jgi:hypothetical protein|nr:hypothetical protein [Octadecabacter sp.]